MALITEEVYLSTTTPTQLVSSALVARHVYLHVVNDGLFLGSANDNTHGAKMLPGDALTFTLAAGDALWAWASSGNAGPVDYIISTALGL